MKDMLWLMFKKTGKIEYYMKYKELDGSGNRGHSSK